MSTTTTTTGPNIDQMISPQEKKYSPKSLWAHAWSTLLGDRIAIISLVIVVLYVAIAILSATGIIASEWDKELGASYAAPSTENFLGLDIFGRSVADKMIKGTEVAMLVGFTASVLAIVIGVFLGAIAGYFGGKVDDLIVWFYTTVSSIPWIMSILGIAMVLDRGLHSIVISLGFTSWTGICRIIRGEIIKHKQRDYVQAASAIGTGHFRKLFRHILPNVFHLVIIQFSLLFQTAIKTEVILSYLGLGVQGRPSWGIMIDDAKQELARDPMVWWGLAAATGAMFFIVLALNLLGDALRDALDPKLKGK